MKTPKSGQLISRSRQADMQFEAVQQACREIEALAAGDPVAAIRCVRAGRGWRIEVDVKPRQPQ